MIKGKGLWIWQVQQLLSVYNTLQAAVAAAVNCGFSHVLVKVANGWYPWLPNTPEGAKITEFLQLARAAGLQVVLWHYSYGYTLSGERSGVTQALNAYWQPGDPYVEDVEVQYKRSGSGAFYKALTGTIRERFAGIKIGYSSFRFPSLHQEIPWGDLTEASDFCMPQVYWEGATNPASQLERSFDEYHKFSELPYYAAGAAYTNKGWVPTDEQLDEFSYMAKGLNILAINWWRWDTAVALNLWDTMCRQDWGGQPPPVITDKEKLDRLWAAHPELHPS